MLQTTPPTSRGAGTGERPSTILGLAKNVRPEEVMGYVRHAPAREASARPSRASTAIATLRMLHAAPPLPAWTPRRQMGRNRITGIVTGRLWMMPPNNPNPTNLARLRPSSNHFGQNRTASTEIGACSTKCGPIWQKSGVLSRGTLAWSRAKSGCFRPPLGRFDRRLGAQGHICAGFDVQFKRM